jgi:hypothetical protein
MHRHGTALIQSVHCPYSLDHSKGCDFPANHYNDPVGAIVGGFAFPAITALCGNFQKALGWDFVSRLPTAKKTVAQVIFARTAFEAIEYTMVIFFGRPSALSFSLHMVINTKTAVSRSITRILLKENNNNWPMFESSIVFL